jgi:hypothetical protein
LSHARHCRCQCRAWLLVAIAHHRLGHSDEARHWLEKAERWLDADTTAKRTVGEQNVPWANILPLHLLREEAKALVLGSGKRVPSPAVP